MNTHTIFIVEADNDKAFINLMLQTLGILGPEVRTLHSMSIETLHLVEGSEDRGKTALAARLGQVKNQLRMGKYENVSHIGIILDIDAPPDWTYDKNVALIRKSVGKIMGVYPDFSEEGQPISVNANVFGEIIPLTFSFYLMKDSSGTGNLDTVLKAIAKGGNAATKCLEELSQCVNGKQKTPLGNFEKQWIHFYLRGAADKDQKEDWERRQHEIIRDRGADLFNLDHETIAPLRAYLAQFQ